MKPINMRLLTVAALVAALSIGSLGSALGQGQASYRNTVTRAQSATSASHTRTVSKARQPAGPRTKASSFAPHPTKNRVFGAPIQPPILNKAQPRKKPPTD